MRSGRSPEEALMILVPEAYKKHPTLMIKYPEVSGDTCMVIISTVKILLLHFLGSFQIFSFVHFLWSQVVDFYEYYKGQMEPWDGPALLLFR